VHKQTATQNVREDESATKTRWLKEELETVTGKELSDALGDLFE